MPIIKGISSWFLLILGLIVLAYIVYDSIEFSEENYDLSEIEDLSGIYDSIDELSIPLPVSKETFPILLTRHFKNIQVFEEEGSSFLHAEFTTVNEFSSFCRELDNNGFLIFENDIDTITSSTFLTYLHKEVKKPFFRRFFTPYDEWVLVYKLSYQNGRLYYSHTWNEGDGNYVYQLSKSNYPPDDIQRVTREIEDEFEKLLSP